MEQQPASLQPWGGQQQLEQQPASLQRPLSPRGTAILAQLRADAALTQEVLLALESSQRQIQRPTPGDAAATGPVATRYTGPVTRDALSYLLSTPRRGRGMADGSIGSGSADGSGSAGGSGMGSGSGSADGSGSGDAYAHTHTFWELTCEHADYPGPPGHECTYMDWSWFGSWMIILVIVTIVIDHALEWIEHMSSTPLAKVLYNKVCSTVNRPTHRQCTPHTVHLPSVHC